MEAYPVSGVNVRHCSRAQARPVLDLPASRVGFTEGLEDLRWSMQV
jgi:hypothetical protein